MTPPRPAEVRTADSAAETVAADSDKELPITGTNDDEVCKEEYRSLR